MNTYNIDFYEDLTKIIFELSSNMHHISSAVDNYLFKKRDFEGYFAANIPVQNKVFLFIITAGWYNKHPSV